MYAGHMNIDDKRKLLLSIIQESEKLSNERILNRDILLFPKRDSYLVDPASSHMLVSRIKPCMCKYKREYSETANGSLEQL